MQPPRDVERRNVAILLFNDVEVLDFAGPFEVFSVTAELNSYKPLLVYTCAETPETLTARNGLKVIPDYSLETAPKPDIIIVPGGTGSKQAMKSQTVIEWLKTNAVEAELVMSVCTGARILAQAGLLAGIAATSHHESLPGMKEAFPSTNWHDGDWQDVRFVEAGKVVTAGGISAGIDASLHVIAKLFGRDKARATADYMEYDTTLF
ncbi:MAG: DJ-1/PfpI family protein [Candidatus Kapabacteria bacterium]|jgi:transcriptional regulator GlxA family with amidase domain|nr:DJ-1/PfpI family protein [Candidatus Kapabacteria bacterium]